jgi:hypothetical protein
MLTRKKSTLEQTSIYSGSGFLSPKHSNNRLAPIEINRDLGEISPENLSPGKTFNAQKF